PHLLIKPILTTLSLGLHGQIPTQPVAHILRCFLVPGWRQCVPANINITFLCTKPLPCVHFVDLTLRYAGILRVLALGCSSYGSGYGFSQSVVSKRINDKDGYDGVNGLYTSVTVFQSGGRRKVGGVGAVADGADE